MSRRRYRPNKKERYEKTVVRLIVDGETEEDYFEHLNNIALYEKVSFKAKKGNESDYKNEKKRDTDNPVYFIVDIDAKKEDTVLNKLAIQDKIYFNNYSFETFLIAHKTPPLYDALVSENGDAKSWFIKHENNYFANIIQTSFQEFINSL